MKILQQGVRESKKFAQILSSIKAIGIVEAPAVAPDPKNAGKYFLLDGHLRVEALRQLEIPTVGPARRRGRRWCFSSAGSR